MARVPSVVALRKATSVIGSGLGGPSSATSTTAGLRSVPGRPRSSCSSLAPMPESPRSSRRWRCPPLDGKGPGSSPQGPFADLVLDGSKKRRPRRRRSPHAGDNMSSPKQLARIAGVFYLLVGIFGGFAEGFVDPKLHAAGNAAATAANVAANAELVRMGVVAHLVDGVFFALTAMTLYLLLNHVHKNAARSMVIFVVIAVGMICLNAVFLFEGMQVATDPSYVA